MAASKIPEGGRLPFGIKTRPSEKLNKLTTTCRQCAARRQAHACPPAEQTTEATHAATPSTNPTYAKQPMADERFTGDVLSNLPAITHRVPHTIGQAHYQSTTLKKTMASSPPLPPPHVLASHCTSLKTYCAYAAHKPHE